MFQIYAKLQGFGEKLWKNGRKKENREFCPWQNGRNRRKRQEVLERRKKVICTKSRNFKGSLGWVRKTFGEKLK